MGDKIVIHTGKSSGFTNTHQNSKAVSNRLSRAIGHLESIRRMVEDGRDCTEVLVQLSAVKSAVNNAGKVILQDYIEHASRWLHHQSGQRQFHHHPPFPVF